MSRPGIRWGRGFALLLASLAPGCGDHGASSADLQLPVLTLSEPSLEIGVLEGDDELSFAALESVIRLPDGSIAVSDGGATRISIFDADGGFVRSWGSQGEGPGEFRSLSRIYRLGTDSLMAAERYSGRLATFDLHGELGRLQAGSEVTGDSTFTLDSWLMGRFWIEGALTREERRAARGMLEGLDVPAEWPGYRYALATEDGALWIREPGTDGSVRTWTRMTPDGPTALLRTPSAFRPTQVRADEVLGVWSGPSGVHFVRVYRPTSTGETASAPGWLASPGGSASSTPAGPALTEDELMAEIRSAIKNMASAQEIHYSSHMSYTTAVDSLEAFERPETIGVDFLRGDARGWAAVFSHASIDRICALGYGFGTPPGWMPGSVLCAPQSDPVGSTTGAPGS